MKRQSFEDMNCTIAKALDQVGEWWSLLIIREITQGASRFDEIQAPLGIARNILTTRLERLTELGIVDRFPLPDRPGTLGYKLTQKGEELYPVLVALQQWGDRWLICDGNVPTTFVDDASGKPLAPIAVRSADGTPVSFRDVRFEPGPAATENTMKLINERNRRVLGSTR
jgi:DNA-binding HxlR family transcriptional regulator